MAKHFKEQQTEEMPRTRVRRQRVEEFDGPKEDAYGVSASYRTSYADPVVDEDYYDSYVPARGGIRAVGRGILLVLAWACRLAAIAGVAVVIVNMPYARSFNPTLIGLMDALWYYVPWEQGAHLAVDTPFGGTFYGDVALASILLFVIDWLLCRLRAALR